MEIDSASGSIYLGEPGVVRHHFIIRNTDSSFPRSLPHALSPSIRRSTQSVWLLMHSCEVFIDPPNLCALSWPVIPSYYLTLFLHSVSVKRSLSQIPFVYHMRCGRVYIIRCLPSSTALSSRLDWLDWRMHSEGVIKWTWRPYLITFGYPLGGSDRVSLEMHMKAVIMWTWRT